MLRASEDREPCEMTPMRGTFFGCCALAVTATASNAPANRIDASAGFLNGRLISGVIYHADGSKEKCYLRAPLLSGCLENVRVFVSDKNTGRHTRRYRGMKVKGLQ